MKDKTKTITCSMKSYKWSLKRQNVCRSYIYLVEVKMLFSEDLDTSVNQSKYKKKKTTVKKI